MKTCKHHWLAAALATLLSPGAQGAEPEPAASPLPGCALPTYPRASAKNNESGTVVISLLVDSDGRPTGDAKVVKSSGYRDLDRATLDGFHRCRFPPHMVDGTPAPGWTQVTYTWEIRGPRASQLDRRAASASQRAASTSDKAGNDSR